MPLKTLLKQTLLWVAITGLVLSFALIFYFIPKSSVGSSPAIIIENVISTPEQERAGSGLPMRLTIPKINVDSYIEHVGLASDGAMDIPKSYHNVAWFELGQSPGENGSAVISGHYGWKDGESSVFDNLYKLRKGDIVFVEDDMGMTIPFVVRESRRYDLNADVSIVFNSNDGKAHLNLFTCEGEWDELTQQYPRRLVVFTDRLE